MSGEIKVKLPGRGYDIQIGSGLLKRAGGAIRKVSKAKQVLILSVPKVYGRYGALILKSLTAHFKKVSVLEISDGEVHKNEKTLISVLRKMKQLEFHRDSCVVALGGGVVGDLGGLAASLYMRGTDFVQVPTTLLAQVDASVGGKTAIDFLGIKNLIGSFYQPKLVLIDPNVLKSLDARQMRTGLAEIIKYGVIRDLGLFEKLEKNIDLFFRGDGRFLTFLIRRSVGLKAAIISEDEK
ncbi:MAG: 3-dehydroquinate synthase family protein, partial [bacterium]